MLTICLVKLISILINYKVKVNFYNQLIYHWMFLGKSRINYISLEPLGKKQKGKKEKYPADINKAYVNSVCLLACMKRKSRQKILTRISVLSSHSGPSAAILAKCPVISLAH